MKTCPLKLPPEALDQLQRQAARLQAYPSALARALVMRGLDQLENGESPCTPHQRQ
jgi:hypothetical protein